MALLRGWNNTALVPFSVCALLCQANVCRDIAHACRARIARALVTNTCQAPFSFRHVYTCGFLTVRCYFTTTLTTRCLHSPCWKNLFHAFPYHTIVRYVWARLPSRAARLYLGDIAVLHVMAPAYLLILLQRARCLLLPYAALFRFTCSLLLPVTVRNVLYLYYFPFLPTKLYTMPFVPVCYLQP